MHVSNSSNSILSYTQYVLRRGDIIASFIVVSGNTNLEPFLNEEDKSLTFQVQILGQYVLVEES